MGPGKRQARRKGQEAGVVGLATVCMTPAFDKRRNLQTYFRYIDQAAGQGASLIVFPEMSLQGYLYGVNHEFTREEMDYHCRNAEPVPGESTNLLIEKAREKNIYVVFGMTENAATRFSPVLCNSAVLVGPEGLLGVYRKVHLIGDEKMVFRPGDRWPVFETGIGRIGIFICFDLIFPESTRELTLNGAEILAMPTAWPGKAGNTYDLLCRVRPMENHRWLVTSGQVGTPRGSMEDFNGRSLIVKPSGKIIAETGSGKEGLTVATVNMKEEISRHESNLVFYALPQRRPETYKSIACTELYEQAEVSPGS